MIKEVTDKIKSLQFRLSDFQTKTLKKVLKYLDESGEDVLEIDLVYFDSLSEVGDLYLLLQNNEELVKNIQICPEEDAFVSVIGKLSGDLDNLYKLELL